MAVRPGSVCRSVCLSARSAHSIRPKVGRADFSQRWLSCKRKHGNEFRWRGRDRIVNEISNDPNNRPMALQFCMLFLVWQVTTNFFWSSYQDTCHVQNIDERHHSSLFPIRDYTTSVIAFCDLCDHRHMPLFRSYAMWKLCRLLTH